MKDCHLLTEMSSVLSTLSEFLIPKAYFPRAITATLKVWFLFYVYRFASLLLRWCVFYAGDARASEQPALAAIQTLFLREHNRLAEGLSALNPQWSDEKLYQTARRILSAVTQHITYREFLPRLFGWDGVHEHSLTPQTEGYYQGQTTFPLSQ